MSDFLGEQRQGLEFLRDRCRSDSRAYRAISDELENLSEALSPSEDFISSVDAMTLQGRERIWDSMAQGIPSGLPGMRNDRIRDAFSSFMDCEHRMETVAVSKGIRYVNDSKSTNVNSTWFTLESTQGPIVWIMGGIDKGNDYTRLAYLVQRKVKAIVMLGRSSLKIHRNFASLVDVVMQVDTMEDAIRISSRLANVGDTVLLSPACASFDLFIDYQDRGRQFKEQVLKLS
jgi:UDP-N-acetylmuramoylalanine--D-glutamate ligase